jgi:hypothetical protein
VRRQKDVKMKVGKQPPFLFTHDFQHTQTEHVSHRVSVILLSRTEAALKLRIGFGCERTTWLFSAQASQLNSFLPAVGQPKIVDSTPSFLRVAKP